MLATKLFGRHSAEHIGEHQASCGIPLAIPRINQHSILGKLTNERRGKEQGDDLHTNFL
jgi:hypothetical protein